MATRCHFVPTERVTYPFFFWNKRGEADILRLSSTGTRLHSIHGMRTGIFHSFYRTVLIMPSFFTHIIDPFCAALDIPKDSNNANFTHAVKFKLTHAC